MNCECGGKLNEKRVKLHRYIESGLPNVFLVNIKVAICRKCGEIYPIIPSILSVHESIAEAIALKPVTLNGAEIRFLRKQLGITAARWATYLKMDKASVSRLENAHNPVSRQTDALARLLYFRLLEEKENRHINENIASRIASVEANGDELGLKVPADNPSAYSFVAAKVLAESASSMPR